MRRRLEIIFNCDIIPSSNDNQPDSLVVGCEDLPKDIIAFIQKHSAADTPIKLNVCIKEAEKLWSVFGKAEAIVVNLRKVIVVAAAMLLNLRGSKDDGYEFCYLPNTGTGDYQPLEDGKIYLSRCGQSCFVKDLTGIRHRIDLTDKEDGGWNIVSHGSDRLQDIDYKRKIIKAVLCDCNNAYNQSLLILHYFGLISDIMSKQMEQGKDDFLSNKLILSDLAILLKLLFFKLDVKITKFNYRHLSFRVQSPWTNLLIKHVLFEIERPELIESPTFMAEISKKPLITIDEILLELLPKNLENPAIKSVTSKPTLTVTANSIPTADQLTIQTQEQRIRALEAQVNSMAARFETIERTLQIQQPATTPEQASTNVFSGFFGSK